MTFYTGNVVKCPRGYLYIVSDNPKILLPFNSTNSSVHPPIKRRYRIEIVEDEDGHEKEKQILEAHGINEYKYVADNVASFIENRLKYLIYGDF